MMDAGPTGGRCPRCGAELRPAAKYCWLCLGPCQQPEAIAAAQAVARPPEFVHHENRFSLATLLTLITLIAVGLGLARIELGYGIVFAIVITPAVIATTLRTRWERALGRKFSRRQQVGTCLAVAMSIGASLFLTVGVTLFALVMLLNEICEPFRMR